MVPQEYIGKMQAVIENFEGVKNKVTDLLAGCSAVLFHENKESLCRGLSLMVDNTQALAAALKNEQDMRPKADKSAALNTSIKQTALLATALDEIVGAIAEFRSSVPQQDKCPSEDLYDVLHDASEYLASAMYSDVNLYKVAQSIGKAGSFVEAQDKK